MEQHTKAIGLVRVSTRAQADSSLGLAAQKREIWTFCKKHHYEIQEIVEEKGVSGSCETGKRQGLIRAISLLNKDTVLVVAKRDRISRDVGCSIWVEQKVEAKGSKIISTQGEGSGSGDSNYLFRRLIDSFADYERRLIGSRTKKALRERKEQGQRTGKVPYGFKEIRARGRNAKGKSFLAINEDEQKNITQIMRMKACSLSAITKKINNEGKRNRLGNPFNAQSVKNIILNETKRKELTLIINERRSSK